MTRILSSILRWPLRKLLSQRQRTRIRALLSLASPGLNDEWAVLGIIGPVDRDHVILDIGAHHGWFFHCWLDWCPRAEVHAFEPFPESFDVANKLYGADSRVKLRRIGVGDAPGEQAFNAMSESAVSNSFLAPVTEAWETVRYHTGEITQITVPVTTVDAYVRDQKLQHIYLAKIDVQGYEMHVLRGAEQSLPMIDHIFIEVGIERLYEGAPRFNDVFEFLTERGFHLMTLRAWLFCLTSTSRSPALRR